MRRFISLVLFLAMSSLAAAQSTQPASLPVPASSPAVGVASVPVQRVVLYSSGVGYFEHSGTVPAQARTELRFKSQQINDILKSLVLQDLDGGTVSTITYPSQDPIGKILKSFQVDLAANPSLAQLLHQLRGARVSLLSQGEELSGTILSVEQRAKAVEKGTVEQAVLNVLSGGIIRSVALEQVTRLELLDEQLQQELAKALEALAQARDQEQKPVSIQFQGQGQRRVRIGYVVETPIWKSSYRLILGAGAEKPSLQGWAIVENQTDNDWSHVQLSLVSGRPISFIQDLYQPLYLPRPLVQPELYASLRPQTYEGGMDANRPAAPMQLEKAAQLRGGEESRRKSGAPAKAKEDLNRDLAAQSDSVMLGTDGGVAQMSQAMGQLMDATASVASVASASKLGELFQYTVGNVSLPRQRSAMIPILTEAVEIQRLSIYNSSVLPRHPLNGVRLRNSTGKHLLQGPVTVLEASAYAGDARIDNVPPGQERLLSYGVDLELLVDASKNTRTDTIQTGKIVRGVLYLKRKHVMSQEYIAQNKSEKDKTLVIEHPVRAGWKLLETEKPVETTEAVYRFQGPVARNESRQLTVKEEMVADETLVILPADIGMLDVYRRSGEIPQAVKDALAKAIAFKQALADTRRQMAERQQQIGQITQEQSRLRNNMAAVTANSEYYQRLLKKLNDQESQIEQLQTRIEELKKQQERQTRELDDYLAGLEVE